jgi:hypothetical protein
MGGAACAACGSGMRCDTSNGRCVQSGGDGGTGCSWTAGPGTSNGELTCYWFSQGTATGQGCPSYKTYCGYCGTQSGSGSGICPAGIMNTVPNTATPYFVAFPTGTFAQGRYCGMCVNITWMGRSIIATVVDACATCPNNQHLDLSMSAAIALGVGQNGMTGNPTSGVTWQAVACPTSSNIVALYNNGYAGQIYFQNLVFPIASASAGGRTGMQMFGYWDFGAAVSGQSVTLTDTLGHQITGTIPTSSGGSIGAQFPMVCQ